MSNRIFFETDELAVALRISRDDYEALKNSVLEEFPDDEMMYQLHLLRALHATSQNASSAITE